MTILTDAGGTLLAALLAIIVTAWWKAVRLSLQLTQLADILRSITDRTYQGFTGASDKELRTEAESNLSAVEADIEKSAEGIFRLNRRFRFEIDALKRNLETLKVQGRNSTVLKNLPSSDPISDAYRNAALDFEGKARGLAHRAWKRFWLYMLP